MMRITLALLTLAPGVAFASPECKTILSSQRALNMHMPAIKHAVATLWEQRRLELDTSQTEAARALGVAQSTFYKLLRKQDSNFWTEAQLRALARALEVPVDRLMPPDLGLPTLSADTTADFIYPTDWTPHIQALYAKRGMNVTAAEVKPIADEAAHLCTTGRSRGLPTNEVVMEAVLEVALKKRPSW